jgi:hypothetical protein
VSVFLVISFLASLLIFFLPKIGFLYSLGTSLAQSAGLDSFFKSMILRQSLKDYGNLAFFSICSGVIITILSLGLFYWVKSLIIERKIRKSKTEVRVH